MNAKEEQKERSHETILESASRLLREKGIAGARVAEVMKGAGLTVGGFYAHFDSKEALIEEALRRTAWGMRRRLFLKLEDKPAADRAEVVLKRYLSVAHRDAPTEGCPLPAVVGEIGTTAPEHGEILSQEVDKLVGELETHIGSVGPLSRRHLALGLVALMVGGLSLARALRGTELSDEVLRACRALGAFAARSTVV
ncbi:TetR/AcrR family transcriptional regulator [Pendulispora brunnea]|uniref:TetR/AcrR family transcriptional regulator n=1 Tax=Pendulispora brunnea TaxID=2905690 RepID=A0ABZ2KBB0_9BACT